MTGGVTSGLAATNTLDAEAALAHAVFTEVGREVEVGIARGS